MASQRLSHAERDSRGEELMIGIGSSRGPYEIVAALGAGGMGIRANPSNPRHPWSMRH